MRLEIPTISGVPLKLTVNSGERLFVVGANGTGKSALIQHFVSLVPREKVRRISAHRQTWFRSERIDLTPLTRHQFGEQILGREFRDQARWMDEYAEQRQSAVLFDLVALQNERANRIANYVSTGNIEAAIEAADERASPFAQINNLLELGSLSVRLETSSGDEILARHEGSDNQFSIAQMSDGERNAALIAANVLTVKEDSVLLIDEPERHLHRSIIEPFLMALFQHRQDCSFVISTHEIALPATDPKSRVLVVRSCTWNGDKAGAWDVELLEPNDRLPEELRRAILGSRKRILFVEGNETSSLDLPLYNALFPDTSIVPKESSDNVKRAVSGLRGSEELHHVEAFGLIDRDNLTEDEVAKLASEKIFPLNVYSVEALYYCSEAIAAVALRQAESLGQDADIMTESAKGKALDAMNENCLAERMAARRCERFVRNSMISEIPDWRFIRRNPTANICASISSPFPHELGRFRRLLADRKLDELISYYPIRESRVFDVIARALQLTGKDNYQKTLLSRLRDDATLAETLRRRIGPLSEALTENRGL